MAQSKTIMQRFWEKVDKTPGHGPNGECWLWTGCVSANYGMFHLVGADSKQCVIGSHRFSYAYHVGGIPVGLDVLHSCDIPSCVNPAHLRVGTHKENIIECFSKWRHPIKRGEDVPYSKLTEEQVFQIRREWKMGMTTGALSAKYGMSRRALWAAAVGKTWRHLPFPPFTS